MDALGEILIGEGRIASPALWRRQAPLRACESGQGGSRAATGFQDTYAGLGA